MNRINNPCPNGYRIPTETEFNIESSSWSSNNTSGAFMSPLKLTLAGRRNFNNGVLLDVGIGGGYWVTNVNNTSSRYLFFNSSNAHIATRNRAHGGSIRCIKD